MYSKFDKGFDVTTSSIREWVAFFALVLVLGKSDKNDHICCCIRLFLQNPLVGDFYKLLLATKKMFFEKL